MQQPAPTARRPIASGLAPLTTPVADALRTETTPEGVVIVATTEPIAMFHPAGFLNTVRVTEWRSRPMSAEFAERNLDVARRNRGVGGSNWTPTWPPLPPKAERDRFDPDSVDDVAALRQLEDQYGLMPS